MSIKNYRFLSKLLYKPDIWVLYHFPGSFYTYFITSEQEAIPNQETIFYLLSENEKLLYEFPVLHLYNSSNTNILSILL